MSELNQNCKHTTFSGEAFKTVIPVAAGHDRPVIASDYETRSVWSDVLIHWFPELTSLTTHRSRYGNITNDECNGSVRGGQTLKRGIMIDGRDLTHKGLKIT